MGVLPQGRVLVRLGSHRARQKLEALIGYRPQNWFSFRHAGYLAEIPLVWLPQARKIKGIRLAKVKVEEWMRCWD